MLPLTLLLSGCAIKKPTPAELEMADYGDSISRVQAKRLIKSYNEDYLKDPYSAKYRFGRLYKGYLFTLFDGRKFGYVIDIDMNAKNSYGAYVGYKRWRYLLRNKAVVLRCEGVELCPIMRR